MDDGIAKIREISILEYVSRDPYTARKDGFTELYN